MNQIVEFFVSLGFSTKELHGLKSKKKVQKLAKYYNYRQCPILVRGRATEFLEEFIALENKNPETFRLLFERHLASQLAQKGPDYEKLDEHTLTISNLPSDKFYQSREWRLLRYKVLATNGNACMVCGRKPSDGVIIHVDHIMPRSVFPEHALRYSNLQVLCEDCNLGKSNIDSTNWRDRQK